MIRKTLMRRKGPVVRADDDLIDISCMERCLLVVVAEDHSLLLQT